MSIGRVKFDNLPNSALFEKVVKLAASPPAKFNFQFSIFNHFSLSITIAAKAYSSSLVSAGELTLVRFSRADR